MSPRDLSAIVVGSRQSSLSRYLRHRHRILPIGALSFSSPDSLGLSVIVAETRCLWRDQQLVAVEGRSHWIL
ncbi:unnamed protein product [Linum trigynum]|uniref:Uncharacterized protein n=1 Tax=Linum trigynum TaxID=586398 RepID=A0AAV2FVF6_9ROSI